MLQNPLAKKLNASESAKKAWQTCLSRFDLAETTNKKMQSGIAVAAVNHSPCVGCAVVINRTGIVRKAPSDNHAVFREETRYIHKNAMKPVIMLIKTDGSRRINADGAGTIE